MARKAAGAESAVQDEKKQPETSNADAVATAEAGEPGTGDNLAGQSGENASEGGETDPDASDVTNKTTGDAEIGTVVPAGVNMNARKAVVFLGPHHRYSRGDTACFEEAAAEDLVKRGVAVWPKDAKKALTPRPGADDHDTDIG